MKHIVASAFAAFALVPALSSAQTLAIGKPLYAAQCQACHSAAPNFTQNGRKGINNPNAIRSAINGNTGGMGYLSTLSTQDLADIAAYMGNPAGVSATAATVNERVLNWAEWKFQTILLPRTTSLPVGAYTVRGYSNNSLYVGMDASTVYLYSAASGLQSVGALNNLLNMAAADGF